MGVFIFKLAVLAASLAAPALPGRFALDAFFPDEKRRGLESWLTSLLIGHALFTSAMFAAACLGVRLNFSICVFLLAGLAAAFFPFGRRGKGSGLAGAPAETVAVPGRGDGGLRIERASFYFFVSVAAIYFCSLGVVSVCDGFADWPGVGVWGLKAKIIFFDGGCGELFRNPELSFSHPEYPLGYPLSIAWSAFCLGGFDLELLKLVPLFWGVALFLVIYSIGLRSTGSRLFSIIVALCVASGTNYVSICVKMYAEAMFIPYVLLGVFHLAGFAAAERESGSRPRNLALGLSMLALGCWIKTEGVVFLVAAVAAILIFDASGVFKNFKRHFRGVILPLSLLVFPAAVWWSLAASHGLRSADFAFPDASNFATGRVRAITAAFFNELAWNKYDTGVFCSAAVFLCLTLILVEWIWSCRCEKHETSVVGGGAELLFPICVAVLATGMFFLAYFASTRPLWWHLQAVKRVLLAPEVLVASTATASLFPRIRMFAKSLSKN